MGILGPLNTKLRVMSKLSFLRLNLPGKHWRIGNRPGGVHSGIYFSYCSLQAVFINIEAEQNFPPNPFHFLCYLWLWVSAAFTRHRSDRVTIDKLINAHRG